MKRILCLIIVMGLLSLTAGLAQGRKPSDLKYPPLKFEPPDPLSFRTVFANGLRGYMQEDHRVPVVNLAAIINFGRLYDPEEKVGLAELVGATLIKGGTKTNNGEAIEGRLAFLGGTLDFSLGERTATLSLFALSKDLDEALAMFIDVLMNPEFREGPFNLARARLIEGLRQANDQPSVILSREYERLIYGDCRLTWQPTRKSYEGITVADLKAAHGRFFCPENIVLAAAGDLSRAELVKKVNKVIAPWNNGKRSFPAFSKVFPEAEPGVYFVQKKINQGYISLGHLGIEDTNPDYFVVQLMDSILSREIRAKVRTDEGLAYDAGSRFTYRWGFPGTFSGFAQTQSSTAGYAISLILKEFERIRRELVSDGQLGTEIGYFLETFPDNFSNPLTAMTSFGLLEMQGKSMDYYKTYRDRIKRVTKERVLQAAQTYVHPEKAAIMIIGDWDPCNKGSNKFPGPLDKLGKVHWVSLRDPLAGVEIKGQ